MASYWIVVPRGNNELFDLLSIAFRGRSGFTVIVDRRSGDAPNGVERRGHRAEIGPDDIIVAEQAVRIGQQSGPGDSARRVVPRGRPVVRGRLRRQGGPAGGPGRGVESVPVAVRRSASLHANHGARYR